MANSNSNLGDGNLQGALLDDPEFLREIVERVVQGILEAEMEAHIGAAPYERNKERRGQRNGYKPRMLRTRVGTLNLAIPQDREGTFSTSIFARYQRNEKALVLSLMEMYIQGVSTRKVKEITEVLCGTSFSKSQVSALAGGLDAELNAWRKRPLSSRSYPIIFVDAHYQDVRIGGRVISQGVLIVKAIRGDGKREILAVEVADTESESTYNELFSDLKDRGLSGVLLVVSDAHKGLKKAAKRYFQGASWQRCQVHFSGNAMGLVKRAKRKEVAADIRKIFTADEKAEARRLANEAMTKWQETNPKVTVLIDEHIEECFSAFDFPASIRPRIRSTNGLERFHEEVRRRTRVVRIFPNRESCLRLISAICVEHSEEWTSGKRYVNPEELAESAPAQEQRQRDLAAVK